MADEPENNEDFIDESEESSIEEAKSAPKLKMPGMPSASQEHDKEELEKKAEELKRRIEAEKEKIDMLETAEAPEMPAPARKTPAEEPELESAPESEIDVPEPPKGIKEFEEEVKKEKKAALPAADPEEMQIKERLEQIEPKIKIMQWDYEHGQINPAKKVQYDKLLEEQKKLTARLMEIQRQ